MTHPQHPRYGVERLGDRALSVRFESRPSKALSRTLASFARSTRSIPGVVDAVPGYRSVLIEIEPSAIASIARALSDIDISRPAPPGPVHQLRIVYDGPDLEWVCRAAGMEPEEFKEAHASKVYDVCLIGSPGFIYLSAVTPRLSVPRLDRPRPLVPAGSVGIAGRQSGIYGRERPGGWRIIGSVETVPEVTPGDRVAFQR